MITGIINVYKEAGYTSRDAVSRLTGILRQQTIGHTGTLDPDAEGVLPMCVGRATKLCEYLTDHDKKYEAVIKFGIATDTEDMTGKIIESTDFDDKWYENALTEENLNKVIKSFIGKQLQTPPMYSAKRVNGKRLYELAREGRVIERKPCEITVYDIKITDINVSYREATILISCSKGTYIRTLCKDIGESIGSKAAMKRLLRTETGEFSLKDSHKLDEIEEYVKMGKLQEILIPIEKVFKDLPKINVKGHASILLDNGGSFEAKDTDYDCKKVRPLSKFRMYNKDGEFKAVYYFDEKSEKFKVYKMF